jgi:alpha-1,2-mannosyltransferase
MQLWSAAGQLIQLQHPLVAAAVQPDVNVCVGSEWYLFPTHFFLPVNARLQYVEDGFHGVLPAHFETVNGTSAQPRQPFNNENREEPSRYIDVSNCDYVVRSNDPSVRSVFDRLQLEPLLSRSVFLTTAPGHEWSRAYNIPSVSSALVLFKSYELLVPVQSIDSPRCAADQ